MLAKLYAHNACMVSRALSSELVTRVYVQGAWLVVDEPKVNRTNQPAHASLVCVINVFAHASRFSCVSVSVM